MIAPESLRASRTRWRGQDVLTFEWCSTTGGEHPRTHHHARSMIVSRLSEGGVKMNGIDCRIEDSLGPGGDLFFQMGSRWPSEFYARTYRVGTPPTLREQFVELPVVEADRLLACGFVVLRSKGPFTDHLCWVEALRNIMSNTGPYKDMLLDHALKDEVR